MADNPKSVKTDTTNYRSHEHDDDYYDSDYDDHDVTHCCLTNQLIKALGIQLSSHLVFGDCDNWNCVDNNDDHNDQALCIIKGP